MVIVITGPRTDRDIEVLNAFLNRTDIGACVDYTRLRTGISSRRVDDGQLTNARYRKLVTDEFRVLARTVYDSTDGIS